MKKPLCVKVCPRCNSRNINFEKSPAMAYIPVKYVCKRCGCTGYIFPEMPLEKAKKLKLKSVKK